MEQKSSRLRDALIAIAVFAAVIALVVVAGKIARSGDRPAPYDKGAAALVLRG